MSLKIADHDDVNKSRFYILPRYTQLSSLFFIGYFFAESFPTPPSIGVCFGLHLISYCSIPRGFTVRRSPPQEPSTTAIVHLPWQAATGRPTSVQTGVPHRVAANRRRPLCHNLSFHPLDIYRYRHCVKIS
jgi:hypothetical protein